MKSKLTPAKELEELKHKMAALNTQRDVIRDRITQLEDSLMEPFLKKKYLGKYFVYYNRYSSEETWPLYFRVLAIEGSQLIVTQFETEKYGESRFKLSERTSTSSMQKRITKRQWDSALKKFLSNAQKLK